jgi:hypothetical protein
MDEPTVTLATLGQGAAGELFEKELQEVLKNIADVNTDPKAKREVLLRVSITPNDEREMGDTVVSVVSKLAPVRKVKTLLFLGRRQGRLVAVESNPKQLTFDEGPPRPVAVADARKET